MLSKDEINARSLRLSGRAPNRLTGTLNDPFEQAQSNYAGPGWGQFFGGLQKAEEDAQLGGKNYRVNWGGFGNAVSREDGGYDMPRGRVSLGGDVGLNPLEAQAQKEFLRQQQANDAIERAKAEVAGQKAYNDAESERVSGSLRQGYQDHVFASNFAQPEPTTVTRTVGITPFADALAGKPQVRDTITARPTIPPTVRERMLSGMNASQRLAAEKVFQDMDLRSQDMDLKTREANLADRKQREVERKDAPLSLPTDPSTGVPITGEAFLKTLAPPIAKVVTSLLEGRTAIPTGTAAKDPYWRRIIEAANVADPSFDTVNYNSRNATRQDFTKGKAAGQINAINTVAGHLRDLADKGEKLGNFGMNWMNSIYNALTPGGTKRGVALNDFETLKEGVATELMRTWRQVGAGSEKEIEDWKAQIGSAKSPEELRGAFKTIGGMLESKLSALDEQYRQGMGTQAVTAISPESRAKLDALQGIGSEPPAKPRNPFRK